MALFPAGASFLCNYAINATAGGTAVVASTSGISWLNAARAGKPTRLMQQIGAGFPGQPPSYPNGANPPVAVGGILPVPAMANNYIAWGLRRIPGADWVEIADMVSIDPPMKKTGSAQITVLKSLQTGREYIPGFVDGDTVKCKARYSRTLYNFLDRPPSGAADVAVGGGLFLPGGGLFRLTTFWSILFPADFQQGEITFGGQICFAAFVQEHGPPSFSAEDDKVIDLDFTLKVTGPTIAYPGL